jgi:hypothetical protein
MASMTAMAHNGAGAAPDLNYNPAFVKGAKTPQPKG